MIRRLTTFGMMVLLLAGCADLDTRYGERSGTSVNGFAVLHERCAAVFELGDYPSLSPRAAERDLLIHVSPYFGAPDPRACLWLEHWLAEREGRQAIIFLRDGAVSSWLCRHWAEEARAEAKRTDGSRREVLVQQADRLLERAMQEEDPGLFMRGGELPCSLFRLMHRQASPVKRISGLINVAAPALINDRSQVRANDSEALISYDGSPWAIAIPMGKGRLVVVANTVPFLDGAQVDFTCRRLLMALLDDLVAHGATRAAWIDRLSPRPDQEAPPPNILAILLGRPPFSWVAWHLLVLVGLFVAARAYWLGRCEPLSQGHLQRFARHVDALAQQLARTRAAGIVVQAIATHLRRKAPDIDPHDNAAAAAAVAALYGPPAPTVSPHSPKEIQP